MPAKRIWPATDSEVHDRLAVEEAVRVTGQERIYFTTQEIRLTLARLQDVHDGRFRLNHSKQLHRHLRDLEREKLMVPMGKHLWGAGKRNRFVLAERVDEIGTVKPVLDDLEKVYAGLHVAAAASGEEAVPTRLVTEVLRGIPAFLLDIERDTAVHLATLAKGSNAIVENLGTDGGQWTRWRRTGPVPDHPDLPQWVAQARHRLITSNAPALTGHATLNDMIQEWVRLAIQESHSKTWPFGRPMTASDLEAAIPHDDRIREIADAFRRRGLKFGVILGDACKERVQGKERVRPILAKIRNPATGTVYYDVPALEGFEARQLFVTYRAVQHLMGRNPSNLLSEERQNGVKLERSGDDVHRAIGLARLVLLNQRVSERSELFGAMKEQWPILTEKIRTSVSNLEAKLTDLVEKWEQPDTLRSEAEECLEGLGLDLNTVIGAPRPLMTPEEFAEFLPRAARERRRPAELVADALMRRFPNPGFRAEDAAPRTVSPTGSDRVEALVTAARKGICTVYPAFKTAADLLGPDLRDPNLPALLLNSPNPTDRRNGLFALVLLGSDRAITVALGMLQRNPPAGIDIQPAIQALAAMKRIEPSDWPPAVLKPTDPILADFVIHLMSAKARQNWLLRR
jgi:hypothetical protein